MSQADSVVPPLGSKHYYDAVTAGDSTVHDYYRLFFAPGLGHCSGGPGPYPNATFESLRVWVEDGVAPETIEATTVGVTPAITRELCPYPKQQVYNGSEYTCE